MKNNFPVEGYPQAPFDDRFRTFAALAILQYDDVLPEETTCEMTEEEIREEYEQEKEELSFDYFMGSGDVWEPGLPILQMMPHP